MQTQITTCSIEDCSKPRWKGSTGWCQMHYRRWKTHGDPLTVLVIRHGLSSHARGSATRREYFSWAGAKTRCYNPHSPKFALYGGRGITVCERWRTSFPNFLADMGPRPMGTSLDRIDGTADYEPSNCRWATPSEQNKNRRAFQSHEYYVALSRAGVAARAKQALQHGGAKLQ